MSFLATWIWKLIFCYQGLPYLSSRSLTINYFLSGREALFLSLRPLTQLPWLDPPEYIAWLSSIFIKRRRKLSSSEQEEGGVYWENEFSSSRRQKYPPSLQTELRGLPQPLLKLNYFSGTMWRHHKGWGWGTQTPVHWEPPDPQGQVRTQQAWLGLLTITLHRITVFFLSKAAGKIYQA